MKIRRLNWKKIWNKPLLIMILLIVSQSGIPNSSIIHTASASSVSTVEDFEDGTADNWTPNTPARWTITSAPGHGNVWKADGLGSSTYDPAQYENTFSDGSIEMWAYLKWSNYVGPGLWLRTSGMDNSGFQNGYQLYLYVKTLKLARVVDGVRTIVDTYDIGEYPADKWWKLKFEISGSELKGWISKTDTFSSLPNVEYDVSSDSDIHYSGKPGITSRTNMGSSFYGYYDDIKISWATVTWTIEIENNDVKERTAAFQRTDETLLPVLDNRFYIEIDGDLKDTPTIYEATPLSSRTFNYDLSLGSHTLDVYWYDTAQGRYVKEHRSIVLTNDITSTIIRDPSPDTLESEYNTYVIIVGFGDPNYSDYNTDMQNIYNNELKTQINEANELIQEMSYGLIDFPVVGVDWYNPINPITTEYYLQSDFNGVPQYDSDSTDGPGHDMQKQAAQLAFDAIDGRIDFKQLDVNNLIFYFPQLSNGYVNTNEFSLAFQSTDWPGVTGNKQYVIGSGPTFLTAGPTGHRVIAHELMHKFGIADSYFQNGNPYSVDDHEWWGLMGGNVNGHVTSYVKWRLGWFEANIIDLTETQAELTRVKPLFNEPLADMQFGDTIYPIKYTDGGIDKLIFIEYRTIDIYGVRWEGSSVEHGGAPPASYEIVVYEVNWDDYQDWVIWESDFFAVKNIQGVSEASGQDIASIGRWDLQSFASPYIMQLGAIDSIFKRVLYIYETSPNIVYFQVVKEFINPNQ